MSQRTQLSLINQSLYEAAMDWQTCICWGISRYWTNLILVQGMIVCLIRYLARTDWKLKWPARMTGLFWLQISYSRGNIDIWILYVHGSQQTRHLGAPSTVKVDSKRNKINPDPTYPRPVERQFLSRQRWAEYSLWLGRPVGSRIFPLNGCFSSPCTCWLRVAWLFKMERISSRHTP